MLHPIKPRQKGGGDRLETEVERHARMTGNERWKERRAMGGWNNKIE